jgi:hypothetical protein
MQSFAAAAYRSVVPNDATAGWSDAAIDTAIAETDHLEKNEEQQQEEIGAVGDDDSKNTSDEEYIHDSSDDVSDDTSDDVSDDTSDDTSDEEEEDTRRAVDDDREEEEAEADEQEDDNADEDGIDSSDTNVYLGIAGICRSGSREYQKTVQRLAKKHGFDWSDKLFNRLQKKHASNTFRIVDARKGGWRKASANETKSAAKSTLSSYRAKHRVKHRAWERGYRAGCAKERKSHPKPASRQRSDVDGDEVTDNAAEWDYDNYVSDQDKKPSVTKQKAAKLQAKKARVSSTRPLLTDPLGNVRRPKRQSRLTEMSSSMPRNGQPIKHDEWVVKSKWINSERHMHQNSGEQVG